MRKLFILFGLVVSSVMFGQEIGNLPEATTLTGTDVAVFEQSDSTRKITVTNLKTTLGITANTAKVTNTDDQIIDVFSVSGNDIQLSLERDGEGTKTVDVSSTTAVAANTVSTATNSAVQWIDSANHYTGVFNVKDYGAVSGGGDDTQAFLDCIAAAGANSLILLPAGNFHITSKLTISDHRVHIRGAGKYATRITHSPTTDTVLFEFSTGIDDMLVQCSIKELGISSGNTATKTAFKIIDADIFDMENIVVFPWTSTNEDCICLHTNGRDMFSISKIDFWGDRPIVIDDNPNHSIDSDHFHFKDCYFIGGDLSSGNPLVEVISGINVSHLTFDGYQAWAGGSYGVYWNDTETSQLSFNISFNNVRHEQVESGAWSFYIKHNYDISNLSFNNTLLGLDNGIYLRNTSEVSFNGVSFWAGTTSDTAINIDESVRLVNFENTLFQQGSIITNTGAIAISGGYHRFAPNAIYQYTDSHFIPTTQNLLINPTVNSTEPISQITGPQITVANGDSIDIGGPGLMGVLFIGTSATAQAMYWLGTNDTYKTVEIADDESWFSPDPASGNVRIYYTASRLRYVLKNMQGASIDFTLVFVGKGEVDIADP